MLCVFFPLLPPICLCFTPLTLVYVIRAIRECAVSYEEVNEYFVGNMSHSWLKLSLPTLWILLLLSPSAADCAIYYSHSPEFIPGKYSQRRGNSSHKSTIMQSTPPYSAALYLHYLLWDSSGECSRPLPVSSNLWCSRRCAGFSLHTCASPAFVFSAFSSQHIHVRNKALTAKHGFKSLYAAFVFLKVMCSPCLSDINKPIGLSVRFSVRPGLCECVRACARVF